jgi:hypothetical protein
MSKARELADLLDTGGDVVSGSLDNVPPRDWTTLTNKPSHVDIDTRVASNISSGTLSTTRMGSGTTNTSTYLRGDGTWVANCTNHANCTTNGQSNCANCDGTAKTASGSVNTNGLLGMPSIYLTLSGSNISMTQSGGATSACACNC